MSRLAGIWQELQRRHVVRAAVAHVVLFWLLAQVADVVFPYIGIIENPARWAVIAGVALFPVTLVVAWFFEHPWHQGRGGRLMLDGLLIALVSVAAAAWVWRNLPEHLLNRTSIVVLPFQNLDSNLLGNTVSRALTFEINSLLMRSRAMDVVGYETANSELLEGLSLPAVAAELDVLHILTGTVQVAGEVMRVSARLEDDAGNILWQENLSGELAELFSLQEEIAANVAGRLGTGDDTVSIEALAAQRCDMPLEPDALERYYTARHFIESRTASEQSVAQQHEAVALYEGLMEAYPGFAQARSGLAWALMHLTVYDERNADRRANESRAHDLAQQAYDLCPTLGEALVILPNEADHPNYWINQEQQWELWIELQPEATESWQKYTRHLREVGRISDARRMAEHNYALNPLSVRSIKALASIYENERRFDEAVALADRAAELGNTGPNFARQSQAIRACQEDLECMLENLPPPFRPWKDDLRTVYREPNTPEEAQESIDAAMELFRQQPMSLNWFNGASCHRDHLTPLFFQLWDAAREKELFWFWPNVWQPECGNVWNAPEFATFVEEAELVEYWRARGWPDACKPDGDGFTCGQAVFDRNMAVPET